MNGLTIKSITSIFTEGVVEILLLLWMYGQGHADLLDGQSVTDGTMESGRSERWCGHGVLDGGIAEQVGR